MLVVEMKCVLASRLYLSNQALRSNSRPRLNLNLSAMWACTGKQHLESGHNFHFRKKLTA